MDEDHCWQAAQLFANLARAGKSGLATAHLGRGVSPIMQLMVMRLMQQDEVRCSNSLDMLCKAAAPHGHTCACT